jgi:hypothetical protein
MASQFCWGTGFWEGAAAAAASAAANASPQPPTDLTQLLLGVVQQNADSDITQAIVTDYQSPTGETITTSDQAGATTRVGPYVYDEGTHSAWGFAQYA